MTETIKARILDFIPYEWTDEPAAFQPVRGADFPAFKPDVVPGLCLYTNTPRRDARHIIEQTSERILELLDSYGFRTLADVKLDQLHPRNRCELIDNVQGFTCATMVWLDDSLSCEQSWVRAAERILGIRRA